MGQPQRDCDTGTKVNSLGIRNNSWGIFHLSAVVPGRVHDGKVTGFPLKEVERSDILPGILLLPSLSRHIRGMVLGITLPVTFPGAREGVDLAASGSLSAIASLRGGGKEHPG